MEEVNTITYQGKEIAHHFWDKENNKWLIVFEEGLTEEEISKYKKEITDKAHELNLEVEFRNGSKEDKTLKREA